MLQQLLPRGPFLLEPGSRLIRLLEAISYEIARVEARGADLVEESDPRTATETLPEWERVLSLPDAVVTTIPAGLAQRRLVVTQKFVRQGGQSRPYYIALAAACGYTVTIDDSLRGLVLRAGFRTGARSYGTAPAFTWRVDVQPPAGAALSHAELEAVIRRSKPSHTEVLFNYL